MTQQTLFDDAPATSGPPAQDRERLRGETDKLLARLRRGPASGPELMRLTGNHTGRISDLRKQGHTINAARVSGGVWLYTLEANQ
jgi:hypothetical protein